MRNPACWVASALCAVAPSLSARQSTSSLNYVSQFYGAPGEQGFGLRLQVEGERMLVGVGQASPFPKVRVYDRVAGVWTLTGSLITNLVYDFDFEGDLAVAGEITGTQVERMGVHRRINGAWVASFHSAPIASAPIGQIVALDGNTIVASSFSYDGGVTDQGVVFVFENSGTQLNHVATFHGGTTGAWLGACLDIEGDRIVASVRKFPTQSADLRTFVRTPSGWQLESNYAGLATSFNSPSFPHKLEWDADGLGLAAFAGNGGRLVVFGLGLQGWFTEAVIPLGTPALGHSFALDNGVLAIGNYSDDLGGFDSGSVRLWARNQGWRAMDLEAAVDPAQSLWLGTQVEVHGSRVFASATGDDDIGFNHGAIYQYDVAHSPASVVCFAPPHALGCIARIGFSGVPSASTGSGFVLTGSSAPPSTSGALLFGVNGLSSPLLGGGLRCVAPPRTVAAPQNTGGSFSCAGTLSADFNAIVASGNYPQLMVGTEVTASFVFRDPAGVNGPGATDAARFVIGP